MNVHILMMPCLLAKWNCVNFTLWIAVRRRISVCTCILIFRASSTTLVLNALLVNVASSAMVHSQKLWKLFSWRWDSFHHLLLLTQQQCCTLEWPSVVIWLHVGSCSVFLGCKLVILYLLIVTTRWFKYDRDWFVCEQAALHSSCATLREGSHNLHPPSCSG